VNEHARVARTPSAPARSDSSRRLSLPWLAAFALCATVGILFVAEALTNWRLLDATAYEAAAWRIRSGEILYGGDVHHNSAYRYAPWFAYAWVPLTYLPDPVVDVAWSAVLIVGAIVAVRPLIRPGRASTLALLLFAPLMLGSASGGNVQALMVGVLVAGLPTRWGWAAVAFAASLKIIPIAFCAVFIAQRRWFQVAGAVGLTVVLWLPVVWMPVDPITFDTGLMRSLPAPWWIGVPAAGALVALTLAARRSPLTGMAAALAAIAALPRFFAYEVALLLPITGSGANVDSESVRPEPQRHR
jgi:hypothetical protein